MPGEEVADMLRGLLAKRDEMSQMILDLPAEERYGPHYHAWSAIRNGLSGLAECTAGLLQVVVAELPTGEDVGDEFGLRKMERYC